MTQTSAYCFLLQLSYSTYFSVMAFNQHLSPCSFQSLSLSSLKGPQHLELLVNSSFTKRSPLTVPIISHFLSQLLTIPIFSFPDYS